MLFFIKENFLVFMVFLSGFSNKNCFCQKGTIMLVKTKVSIETIFNYKNLLLFKSFRFFFTEQKLILLEMNNWLVKPKFSLKYLL